MATFHFDFVGPERTLYSGEVEAVQLPGVEGEMTVLPGHAPVLTALKVGVITELQAGGGAITDALYYHKANLGTHHDHRIGAFIVTQVIGVSAEGTHAMADAGFKSVGWHPFGGFPLVPDRPDIEVNGLSAEHLKLKPTDTTKPIALKRGEKVQI